MADRRLSSPLPDRVPAHLRGAWRRLSIEYGDGSGDIATTVVWLQSSRLYCDIRVPSPRPAAGARGFAGLTVEDAVALAAQEGFAGALSVDGGRCAWERWIDYRPLGAADVGDVARAGRMLVETGVDAAYVEHWWQDLHGQDLDAADILTAAAHDPATGAIAVRAGDRVMTAIDRRPAPPPGGLAALAADAARRRDAAGLTALLDCEIAYGRLDGPDAWVVELSTLPWTVGERRILPVALRDGEAAA